MLLVILAYIINLGFTSEVSDILVNGIDLFNFEKKLSSALALCLGFWFVLLFWFVGVFFNRSLINLQDCNLQI